ncbi:hypothetical protein I4F81_012443 [Pyropia yezoensis]|uniref:Uncharacterized protein n=1 Tax=Pyropia yezoensis TaxID=2788 RepID=A0ACC3CIP1_PYRYE|nr:hypothetical protein I4F81_012443 [Neopyropia yezoensis]
MGTARPLTSRKQASIVSFPDETMEEAYDTLLDACCRLLPLLEFGLLAAALHRGAAAGGGISGERLLEARQANRGLLEARQANRMGRGRPHHHGGEPRRAAALHTAFASRRGDQAPRCRAGASCV